MGLPNDVKVLRNAKMADVHARMREAVADAGMTIAPAVEVRRRRKEKFAAYWSRLKRRTIDEPDAVVLMECTAAFLDAFDDYGEWLHCGVIFVCAGQVHTLDMTLPDAEVASMRVFMNKSKNELATCAVCMERVRDVACRSCWTGICKECFAACALHAKNKSTFECPSCKSAAPIVAVVRAMAVEYRDTGDTPFQAIRRTMRRLSVTRTMVALECVTDVDCGDCDDGVVVHRRTVAVHLRRDGRVVVESARRRLVEKLLHEPGCDVLVGEIPEKCECCDIVSGADLDGTTFVVDDRGRARESVGMFGCKAACVRAWRE